MLRFARSVDLDDALGLCEAMTRIADDGVPDDVWESAREHFDEEELGHYEPGMFG